ncbi:cysteine desulfurase family protein [Sphingosinithalassobacter sp. CS137]|uniref:cysteine desulfurase family protein n=1 Tax=Sphingosinithalassobacter sp. CS137 TaxID=2762748 RepID=UPI00165EB594|nr:aminotransferase class V-fold PLP-dependent enzyme [Sphingosinithalassobacter sp. CS137]
MATDRLYLDHAATTPLLTESRESVAQGLAAWANPSSPYTEGRAARSALEDARRRIAAAYGWSHETILTSGASEAVALAQGRAKVATRLISAIEHPAVRRASGGAPQLAVGADGRLVLAALEAELAQAEGPVLLTLQWANNETGVLQPVAEAAALVHAAGGLVMVDAAQMPAGWDEGVIADHADFVAVSAHKRGGPPGMGALLVRDLATLTPGGGQEKGYRGGTENLPGALGFAAALEVAEDRAAMAALRTRLDSAIEAAGGETVARDAPRSPAIAGYRMSGVAAAVQLVRFDMAGIAISSGSACSSGSVKPSHVLSAMGWDEAAAREVIRVSFGRGTTAADVDRFAQAWSAIARDVRDRAA